MGNMGAKRAGGGVMKVETESHMCSAEHFQSGLVYIMAPLAEFSQRSDGGMNSAFSSGAIVAV